MRKKPSWKYQTPGTGSGESAKCRQTKTTWIWERIVVWWCIFIGHLSASGKQDNTFSCDTPNHSSSSSSEDSVPVLQRTLLPAHRVKGPPGRVPSLDLIHDSFVTESSTWSHPIQFEWHIKHHSRTSSVGATPEAGYARSASSSLRCCLKEGARMKGLVRSLSAQ